MARRSKESSEDFLRIIGLKYASEILEFLNENEEGQYKDFSQFANSHILNIRLRQLLFFGLIEHHLKRELKRAEWYTITDKGREVLHLIRILIEVSKS